jgi:hypothetical protein
LAELPKKESNPLNISESLARPLFVGPLRVHEWSLGAWWYSTKGEVVARRDHDKYGNNDLAIISVWTISLSEDS